MIRRFKQWLCAKFNHPFKERYSIVEYTNQNGMKVIKQEHKCILCNKFIESDYEPIPRALNKRLSKSNALDCWKEIKDRPKCKW